MTKFKRIFAKILSLFKTNCKNTMFKKIFAKPWWLNMQSSLQMLATIYATRDATLKKSFKNYIYLHNKLKLVAKKEK